MLDTLKNSEYYFDHEVDRNNNVIAVQMKKWAPIGHNPYALESWSSWGPADIQYGGYLLPIDDEFTGNNGGDIFYDVDGYRQRIELVKIDPRFIHYQVKSSGLFREITGFSMKTYDRFLDLLAQSKAEKQALLTS